MRHPLLLLSFAVLVSSSALAQEPASPTLGYQSPSGSDAFQASNILNPNVSAIGWFQAEAGHRVPGPGDVGADGSSFQMKEVELGFQAVVDPWARADFFVSVEPDQVSLEEGYLTWFRLPADLAVKVGKFKANLGRFNRLHTPETPFADRPLAEQNFLGDEGLNGPGVSVSWQVPNPWIFANIDAEAISAPAVGDNPSFERSHQKDNVYIGRASVYQDLTDQWNASLGASVAAGHAGENFDPVTLSSTTLDSRIVGADLTIRWKNPRRAIYRSLLWSTEVLWNHRDMPSGPAVGSQGFFSYVDYQFAQRWHGGLRYDRSEFPTDGNHHENGRLAYVTFLPSEFSQISLQGRVIQRTDGELERLAFLKTTFNIGPHGAHPF